MPVTDLHPISPTHVLPKASPASPKRPPKEILRERSLTPVPVPNPRSPSPRERSPEPEKKPVQGSTSTPAPDAKSRAPSVAPATPPAEPQPEVQSEPEQDDEILLTLSLINMDTFTQILELDEDEENHDFSQPMVWEYFEQAEKTFEDMDRALDGRELDTLSGLGHFLKGSSAALGLSRVQDSCEKIQHLGHRMDGSTQINEDEALAKITKMIKRVRFQYREAQKWLKDFYGEVA